MDDIVKITTDHEEIREWADKYRGRPEIIDQTGGGERMVGLRIDFPGRRDENFLGENEEMEYVSWEEFFRRFDSLNLAFEYEDRGELPDPSASYRFVKRTSIMEVG